jgi:hypothetical protein
MPDLHLCFADHADAASTLHAIGIGDGLQALPVDGAAGGCGFALDLLFGTGTLYEATGETPDPPALTGCHINLRWRGSDVPDALRAHVLAPATPAVRWA